MSVSFELNGQVLALAGELTKHSLRQDLSQLFPDFMRQRQLVIDLDAVSDVDSAGLAWLVNIIRDCRSGDIALEWSHMHPSVLQLARLSNAQHLFQ
jgi:phospholipid transport system transporter-binding protein